ncbi:MAG: hypothetical protein ACE5K9_03730 [Candidatus Methylomirabilales bacterium]
MGKTDMALEWAENELMMQMLEELAKAPLSTIDRFRQEVPKMVEDRAIPAHALMNRISQVLEEIYQQDEVAFARFERETESAKQELRRRLEQLREIWERAQVVHALVRSMFAPALPPGALDMGGQFVPPGQLPQAGGNVSYYGIDHCDKCAKPLENRQWLVGLCRKCEQQQK